MVLYFNHTDLASNPYLGNHDGFSENVLDFDKIFLSFMSYLWSAHVRNLYEYKTKSYP